MGGYYIRQAVSYALHPRSLLEQSQNSDTHQVWMRSSEVAGQPSRVAHLSLDGGSASLASGDGGVLETIFSRLILRLDYDKMPLNSRG